MHIATGEIEPADPVSGFETQKPRTVADLVADVRAAQGRMSGKNTHRAVLVECEKALVWLAETVAAQQDRIESLERV